MLTDETDGFLPCVDLRGFENLGGLKAQFLP